MLAYLELWLFRQWSAIPHVLAAQLLSAAWVTVVDHLVSCQSDWQHQINGLLTLKVGQGVSYCMLVSVVLVAGVHVV